MSTDTNLGRTARYAITGWFTANADREIRAEVCGCYDWADVLTATIGADDELILSSGCISIASVPFGRIDDVHVEADGRLWVDLENADVIEFEAVESQ